MQARLTIMMCVVWAFCLNAHAQQNEGRVTDAFQGIYPITDTNFILSLNGEWDLKVVEGVSQDERVPDVDGSWGKIPVPGCWETNGFCKPTYGHTEPMTGYYHTEFEVPGTWKGKRVVIRLDGVLYAYDLWINGKKAGSWASAYNTALFDITPFIDKKAKRQKLTMKVLSQAKGSDFDCNDDWAPCGIFRDVSLFAVPETHLSDLTITTKMNGEVNVETVVANADKRVEVKHEIIDQQGKVVASGPHAIVQNPKLWTAETPWLYTLRTTLTRKGKVLQCFEQKFGIRELTVEGHLLKLNGQPIKLRGVTCHATDPRTGKVIGDSLTLKDMRLMKEASVNYIRTSHYPREPRFYDLADSLGFYVIDEVSFGYGDAHLNDQSYYPILKQRAQATVRRDKNRACVIVWSVGNENPLTQMCQDLGAYLKEELDCSRPICYPQVGSYFRKFNYEFPNVADIFAPHYPTTGQIASFYQKAERPVVFTEYCHTLGISFEDHDRQWEIIEKTPCIAGGSVWEWVDQGMPFKGTLKSRFGYEEKVFTSKEGGFEMHGNQGTDGLMYANRIPLPNYFELQHNYARAAVVDSVLDVEEGANNITVNVRNRYDFINLKGNVSFKWCMTCDRDTVARGLCSPDCPPHATTTMRLDLPQGAVQKGRVNLLNMEVVDKEGLVFLRQAIPVNTTSLTERLLGGLDVDAGDPLEAVQEGMLVRLGRKATLAEKVTVKEKRLEPYLIKPKNNGNDEYAVTAGDFHAKARVLKNKVGNATMMKFVFSADTTNLFIPEVGLAFLLDNKVDRVQWIGQGPMPTYPGRFRAGRYGFWAMHKDDLYFEGNRMGVDAALFTDEKGEGMLVFGNKANISFEQTDRGIVVTCNAAVAGQGPKFAKTAFPITAKDMEEAEAECYLYRVKAGQAPMLLKQLFEQPALLPPPFKPFETQYDTYLMRYQDIVAESE